MNLLPGRLARAREGRRTCTQMQRIIAPLPTRKARHAACGTKAAMKEHPELPSVPHSGFGRQIAHQRSSVHSLGKKENNSRSCKHN